MIKLPAVLDDALLQRQLFKCEQYIMTYVWVQIEVRHLDSECAN